MNYRENKDSAINRAMNRLENVHQSKKDESQTAQANSTASSALLSSVGLPLAQVENILKESQKNFGLLAEKFGTKLKSDPWATLGKVAIGALVLGVIIGHHSRPSKVKVR